MRRPRIALAFEYQNQFDFTLTNIIKGMSHLTAKLRKPSVKAMCYQTSQYKTQGGNYIVGTTMVN